MATKDILVWTGITVGTLAFAAGSVSPFLVAWRIHGNGSYMAAEDWILHGQPMGELVGGHRAIEHDWFPKGGEAEGRARYQFKVSGDKIKVDLNVLLAENAGKWEVTKAGWHDAEGWHEIPLDGAAPTGAAPPP